MFVISAVGSWVIYHVSRIRRQNLDQFEQAWQQHFEPNRPNVPEAPRWKEDEEDLIVDQEYLRLMQGLPDDHFPSNQRMWERMRKAAKT